MITKLEGHPRTVRRVAFSPDAQRIVTAGEDGVAQIVTLDDVARLLASK